MAKFNLTPGVAPLRFMDLTHGLSLPAAAGRRAGRAQAQGKGDELLAIPTQMRNIQQSESRISSAENAATEQLFSDMKNPDINDIDAFANYKQNIIPINQAKAEVQVKRTTGKYFLEQALPSYLGAIEEAGAQGDFVLESDEEGGYKPLLTPQLARNEQGQIGLRNTPTTFGQYYNYITDPNSAYGVSPSGSAYLTPDLHSPSYKGAFQEFLNQNINTVIPTDSQDQIVTAVNALIGGKSGQVGMTALMTTEGNAGKINALRDNVWQSMDEDSRKDIYNEWWQRYTAGNLPSRNKTRGANGQARNYVQDDVDRANPQEQKYFIKDSESGEIRKMLTPEEMAADKILFNIAQKKVYEKSYRFPSAFDDKESKSQQVLDNPTQAWMFFSGSPNVGWTKGWQSIPSDAALAEADTLYKTQSGAAAAYGDNSPEAQAERRRLENEQIQKKENSILSDYSTRTIDPETLASFGYDIKVGGKDIRIGPGYVTMNWNEPIDDGITLDPNSVGFVKSAHDVARVLQAQVGRDYVNNSSTDFVAKNLTTNGVPVRLYGGRMNDSKQAQDGLHFLMPTTAWFGLQEINDQQEYVFDPKTGQPVISGMFSGPIMVSERDILKMSANIYKGDTGWEEAELGKDKFLTVDQRSKLSRALGVKKVTNYKEVLEAYPELTTVTGLKGAAMKEYIETLMRKRNDWYVMVGAVGMENDVFNTSPTELRGTYREFVDKQRAGQQIQADESLTQDQLNYIE